MPAKSSYELRQEQWDKKHFELSNPSCNTQAHHVPFQCLPGPPQERRFLFSSDVADQSATFNIKDQFSIILSVPPGSFWPLYTVICCRWHPSGATDMLSEQSSQQRCLAVQEKMRVYVQYIMAKGHMFLYNTRVGNTCNLFTLFIVLLSIHRRLWSPYLLSLPCITNTSH